MSSVLLELLNGSPCAEFKRSRVGSLKQPPRPVQLPTGQTSLNESPVVPGVRAPLPLDNTFRTPVAAAPKRRGSIQNEPAKSQEWLDFTFREDEAVRIYVESGLVPSWNDFQEIFKRRKAAGEPVCGKRASNLCRPISKTDRKISSKHIHKDKESISNIKTEPVNPISKTDYAERSSLPPGQNLEGLLLRNLGEELSQNKPGDSVATTQPISHCNLAEKDQLNKFEPNGTLLVRNSDLIVTAVSKSFERQKSVLEPLPSTNSEKISPKNVPSLLESSASLNALRNSSGDPPTLHCKSSMSLPDISIEPVLRNCTLNGGELKNGSDGFSSKIPCEKVASHETTTPVAKDNILMRGTSDSENMKNYSVSERKENNVSVARQTVIRNVVTSKDHAESTCKLCNINTVSVPIRYNDFKNSALETTYLTQPVYCQSCLKNEQYLADSQQPKFIITDGIVGPNSYHLQIINPLVKIDVRYGTSEIGGDIMSNESSLVSEKESSKNIHNGILHSVQPTSQSFLPKKDGDLLDMPLISLKSDAPELVDNNKENFHRKESNLNYSLCRTIPSEKDCQEVHEVTTEKKAVYPSDLEKFGIKNCYVKLERIKLPSHLKHRHSNEKKKKRKHKKKNEGCIDNEPKTKEHGKKSNNLNENCDFNEYIAKNHFEPHKIDKSGNPKNNLCNIAQKKLNEFSEINKIHSLVDNECNKAERKTVVDSLNSGSDVIKMGKIFSGAEGRTSKMSSTAVNMNDKRTNNNSHKASKNIGTIKKKSGQKWSCNSFSKFSNYLKKQRNFIKKKSVNENKISVNSFFKKDTSSLCRTGIENNEDSVLKVEDEKDRKITSVDIKKINVNLPDLLHSNCKSSVKSYQNGEIIPLGAISENRKLLKKPPTTPDSCKPMVIPKMPENITGSMFFTRPEYNLLPEKEHLKKGEAQNEDTFRSPLPKFEFRKDGSCIIRGGRKLATSRNSDEKFQKRKLSLPDSPDSLALGYIPSSERNKKLKIDNTIPSVSDLEGSKSEPDILHSALSADRKGNDGFASCPSVPPTDKTRHCSSPLKDKEEKKTSLNSTGAEIRVQSGGENSIVAADPKLNDNLASPKPKHYKVVSVGFDVAEGSPTTEPDSLLLQLDLSKYEMCYKCSKCKSSLETKKELEQHLKKCKMWNVWEAENSCSSQRLRKD